MNDQRLYERLVSRIEVSPDGCWLWTGACHSSGSARNAHGRIGIGRHRVVNTHRAMWEALYGRVPDGLVVCHSCDVPRCINPAHLWVGTQADNMLDCKAKGRGRGAITHCKHGHPLSGDNVKVTPHQRVCRTCTRARHQKYRCGLGRKPTTANEKS